MIKLPAYFTGFSSLKDGSASLRFETQEITSNDFANFKENHNVFGWLVFSENKDEKIPDEKIEEEGISPSERLRRRMYVNFKKMKREGRFETWRCKELDEIGLDYLSEVS